MGVCILLIILIEIFACDWSHLFFFIAELPYKPCSGFLFQISAEFQRDGKGLHTLEVLGKGIFLRRWDK